MTTAPVHTALADPTLVTPWLETFPVAPPAYQKPRTRTLSREEREPTFENIALGLHQCEEAHLPLNVGTLQGMGACDSRFSRILNYVTRSSDTFCVTHEVIDSDELSAEDIDWFMSALDDGFNIHGNADEARDVMVMIANATGAPMDHDATFIRTHPDSSYTYRKSISQYFEMLTDAYSDWRGGSAYRVSSIDAHLNSEDAYDRANERGVLFLHALVEFVHHEFWEMVEGKSCECDDESPTWTFNVSIECPCGETDDWEVDYRAFNRGYVNWECGQCGCTHDFSLRG